MGKELKVRRRQLGKAGREECSRQGNESGEGEEWGGGGTTGQDATKRRKMARDRIV